MESHAFGGCVITVYDVLGWLAARMSHTEILDDFPELTEEDIRECLEFAADREHRLIAVVGDHYRTSLTCPSCRGWGCDCELHNALFQSL